MSDAQKEQELFLQALDIEDPERRDAFVRQACCGDPGLLRPVQDLLARQSRIGVFLQSPALDTAGTRPAWDFPVESPGTLIARYRLLEQIGEGGFGVVYMAEQEEPVRRKVALKIIKLGMDTRQVVARFEAERQALAMMDHPNIAKVLDAGATEAGRPYFVMELVRGVPITKFCEENRLTIKERLQLFIRVCQAIQHAHQKGVIHRDIKPSNILVTRNEGVPHPMVIDFGVAKAIDQRLTEKTLYTRFAQMIGTPAYMSPEQAEMSKQDVDTRTDVYSLGILLYELLTGTTPFPEERLREAGYAEIQRIISQEEPVRPSTTLSRLNGRLRAIALNRGCEPAALLKLMKGDLDWIVLKAIDKDRNRRYATPSELATDVQRHLTNEAIVAVPPSLGYSLRKFFLRHRLGVAGGGVVALGLTVGLALALYGLFRANIAERRMAEERDRAESEAATSAAVVGFFKDDFLALEDPIRAAEAGFRPSRDLDLRTALEQTARRLGHRFREQPVIEAEVRLAIGRAFQRQRDFDQAELHLRQAAGLFSINLGEESEKTLEAREALAWLEYARGNAQQALAAHQSILEARKRLLPANHEDIFRSMNAVAVALAADAKTYPEAEALFLRVINEGRAALSSNHPIVASAKVRLAGILYALARFDESARLYAEGYEARKTSLGPEHPDTIRSAVYRAYNLRLSGARPEEIERLCKEVLPQCQKVLGQADVDTLLALRELASINGRRGLAAAAVSGMEEIVELARGEYGDKSHEFLRAADMLGQALFGQGAYRDAERVLRSATATRELLGQGTRWEERRSARYLAWTLLSLGRTEEAEALYRTVLSQSREAHGPDAVRTLANTRRLTEILGPQAKWTEISALYGGSPVAGDLVSSRAALGELPLSSGVIASHLAGNAGETRRLLALMVEGYADTPDPEARLRIVQAGLCVGDDLLTSEQRERTLDLAGNVPSTVGGRVMAGLASYRQDAFEDAVTQVQSLSANPDNVVSASAGYILAMSLFRLGREADAGTALQLASQRLGIALRSGLLGREPYKWRQYMFQWVDCGACLILRDQAERLIIGKIVSEPVTTDSLAANRNAWESVHRKLWEFEDAGRHRDWNLARSAILSAMEQGPLNWDPEGAYVRDLQFKAACILALTGEKERYAKLCWELLTHAEADQWHYARCALLTSRHASDEILKRALAMAQARVSAIPATAPATIWHDWSWLFLGIARYRVGDWDQAEEALRRPRESFNLACAGIADAFSAHVATAQGRTADAVHLLEGARTHLQRLLEGNQGGAGQSWHEVALLELSLGEADLPAHHKFSSEPTGARPKEDHVINP